MKKIVRYNGGTDTFYDCSSPRYLIIGKDYEVIYENDLRYQTNYTLKGVAGEFNSCWFKVVSISEEPVYMAFAHTIPSVGKTCECYKLEITNGRPKFLSWSTSKVLEVTSMGNNIFHVKTCNSVYIVQVG